MRVLYLAYASNICCNSALKTPLLTIIQHNINWILTMNSKHTLINLQTPSCGIVRGKSTAINRDADKPSLFRRIFGQINKINYKKKVFFFVQTNKVRFNTLWWVWCLCQSHSRCFRFPHQIIVHSTSQLWKIKKIKQQSYIMMKKKILVIDCQSLFSIHLRTISSIAAASMARRRTIWFVFSFK